MLTCQFFSITTATLLRKKTYQRHIVIRLTSHSRHARCFFLTKRSVSVDVKKEWIPHPPILQSVLVFYDDRVKLYLVEVTYGTRAHDQVTCEPPLCAIRNVRPYWGSLDPTTWRRPTFLKTTICYRCFYLVQSDCFYTHTYAMGSRYMDRYMDRDVMGRAGVSRYQEKGKYQISGQHHTCHGQVITRFPGRATISVSHST